MKNFKRTAVSSLCILFILILSQELFNQPLSFIDTVLLAGIPVILTVLHSIDKDVKGLKLENRYQYEEQSAYNERHDKIVSDTWSKLNHLQPPIDFSKTANNLTEFEHSLNIIDKSAAFADSLRKQAKSEESDSKALGLELKAMREDNLIRAFESGLIARIGIHYTTSWDNKQNCLKIINFRSTKNRTATFYPKANKLNFEGGWTNNASEVLEDHIKFLTDCGGKF